MTNYEKLKLAVYESDLDQEDIEEILNIMESCDDSELQDVCESVEDLLISVMEKEEEHDSHMKYKELASQRKNIPVEKMKNKKYEKNPEKADQYYRGREKLIQRDDDYRRKKPPVKKKVDIDDQLYDKYFHDIEIGEKDIAIKALSYMKSHANKKNPKEYKKYALAFKIFCRRFNIDENSSLWIKYNPGGTITYNGQKIKLDDKMTIGAYTDKEKVAVEKEEKRKLFKKELQIKLPKGYKLIHETEKVGLTVLKPVNYSDKFISQGPGKLGGQYHSTGRVYFTLVKDSNNTSVAYGRDNVYGKHRYELVSPVDYIYVDSEHRSNYDNEDFSNINISKFVNKPVYVKTNIPLKVKAVK